MSANPSTRVTERRRWSARRQRVPEGPPRPAGRRRGRRDGSSTAEAAVEERRADQRLALRPTTWKATWLALPSPRSSRRSSLWSMPEQPAAAVADGQREVLAPELEVLDGAAGGRPVDARVDVATALLGHARQALGRLRAGRAERLRVHDRIRLAPAAVVARPRDPPAPERRVHVVVAGVVGVAHGALARRVREREHE